MSTLSWQQALALSMSLLLLMSGCATRRRAAATTAVAAVATVAAGVAIGSACSPSDEDCEPVVNILFGAIPLITIGAILGGTAIALYATAPASRSTEPLATPPRSPPPALLPDRPAAPETVAVAYQARLAASLGECQEARALLRQLDDLDRAYHAELVALSVFDACR
jgi:hypothetical protein